MTFIVLLFAVVCLAYANGANDNFKGVATLFGSGTTNYRRALGWATITTLLGSIAAVFLAETLLEKFSGKGLVDDALVADPNYLASVALAAASTVLLATTVGMPISTTHSLVGALVGAGWAAGSAIDFGSLGGGYFLPLLVSPVLAIGLTCLLYPAFRFARRACGVTEQTCFCVGSETVEVAPVLDYSVALQRVEQLTATFGDEVSCERRYNGRVLGVSAAGLLDRMHYLSAGLVSFARGLNDTPKIAALLLLVMAMPQFGVFRGTAAIALAIAAGGLISARRVAETMSHKITGMNHGQGFSANLVTSLIVIGASRLGMPVSTTHVSCGSLFGVGTVTRQGHPKMIGTILGAWLITLPVAAVLGAASFWVVARI